jgi:hypothetical protein
VEIKKITAQKADSYNYSLEKDGLKISVDPYREEDRLQEFFGCDLLSRGVLPILVVIENRNAEDGYIFIQDKSGLLMRNPNSKNKLKASGNEGYKSADVDQAVETQNAITGLTASGLGASLAAGGLGLGLVFYLPAIVAEKNAKDQFAIMRNYEDKKLGDKTLYKGGSNNGFIYFQINDKDDINKIVGLQLCMKNIRSKEITTFIIPIKSID